MLQVRRLLINRVLKHAFIYDLNGSRQFPGAYYRKAKLKQLGITLEHSKLKIVLYKLQMLCAQAHNANIVR